MQELGDHRVLGRHRLGVFDEVTQRRFLVATDGHVQADRVTAVLEQVGDLLHRDAGLGRKFLVAGFATQLLMHLALDPGQFVDLLDEMNGQPDGAALIGHAPGDRLADPPRGVGRELESLGVVELLHGADQSEVALLDQVEQRHAATRVALGQRHHQTQVGLEQVAPGRLTVTHHRGEIAFAVLTQPFPGVEQMLCVETGFDALGQFDLIGRIEQCRLADAVQVHPNEVGGRALGVEILVNAAGGGICHNGLLIGWNFHELQRPMPAKSSRPSPGSHLLICGYWRST